MNGVACQPWANQLPNSHGYSPIKYPSSGLEDNYCRDPGGDEGVLCIAARTQPILPDMLSYGHTSYMRIHAAPRKLELAARGVTVDAQLILAAHALRSAA